ncbi:MAG: class I SAM-dependent methyltransferase [Chloroflexi bacterium]|nr:class I SAM-dependent methyltransferase [Chloroflexota bacterium]
MSAGDARWIVLGHPSYVWRFGQDRRIALVQRWVPLENQRILDVGCGIGTYLQQFRNYSNAVYGVDVDAERVARASQLAPNVQVAPAETLPYPGESFDVVFLNEVIEHVKDDRQAIAEAVRVTAPGGHVVIYAPNRLYLFETHGVYLGKRYVFRLIPLVNYLPDALRNRFCPHVRAYTAGQIRGLFGGLPVELAIHTYVFPGFDNIVARSPTLGRLLRSVCYALEQTPLRCFGLSHLLIARKC